MNILSVDTSSKMKTVALLMEDMEVELREEGALDHSTRLLQMIDDLLRDNRLSLKEIDFLALSSGPGSYTGLRIGGATMKGLAFSLGIPILAVSSLEALAENVERQGYIVPLLDARRKEVYTALFKGKKRAQEDVCMKMEDLLEDLKQNTEGTVTFVGDCTHIYEEAIAEALGERGEIPAKTYQNPSALSVAKLCKRRYIEGTLEPLGSKTFMPNYLKEPFIGTRKDAK